MVMYKDTPTLYMENWRNFFLRNGRYLMFALCNDVHMNK